MKKLLLIGATMLLLATAASAQQAPNPQEQIERTIGNLVIVNANLQSQVSTLQAELAKAQGRIKELEPKPDAKSAGVK